MGEDAVGDAPVAARRLLVAVDAHLQRDDRAFRRERDARLVAAVDEADGQVEEEVDDARRVRRLGPPTSRRSASAELRPDAGKAGDRAEEGLRISGRMATPTASGRSSRRFPSIRLRGSGRLCSRGALAEIVELGKEHGLAVLGGPKTKSRILLVPFSPSGSGLRGSSEEASPIARVSQAAPPRHSVRRHSTRQEPHGGRARLSPHRPELQRHRHEHSLREAADARDEQRPSGCPATHRPGFPRCASARRPWRRAGNCLSSRSANQGPRTRRSAACRRRNIPTPR